MSGDELRQSPYEQLGKEFRGSNFIAVRVSALAFAWSLSLLDPVLNSNAARLIAGRKLVTGIYHLVKRYRGIFGETFSFYVWEAFQLVSLSPRVKGSRPRRK